MTTPITPVFTFADAALVVALAVTFLVFAAGFFAFHPKMRRNGSMLNELESRVVGIGMVGIIWTVLEVVRLLSIGGMAPMQPIWDWWLILAVAGITDIGLWLAYGNPREEPEAQRRRRVLDTIEGTPERIKETL